MLIRLKQFAGMRPLRHPRLLGDAESILAANCRLWSGKLQSWRRPSSVQVIGKNSLRWSNAFDNVLWVKNAVTVTADLGTAPDGSITADKVAETVANAVHTVSQSIGKLAAAESWVWSVSIDDVGRTFAFVRMGDGGANFARCIVNLTTGALTAQTTGGTYTGASFAAVADGGYWRVTIIATTGPESNVQAEAGPAFDGTTFSYAGTAGLGVYLTKASLRKHTVAGVYRETYANALPDIKSIYLYKDLYWFASSAISNWIKGPITGDTTDAVYFTGGQATLPSVTYDPIAYNGNNGRGDMPRAAYTMGLPAPATAVTVARNPQTGSITGVTSLITSLSTQTTATFNLTGVVTDGYEINLTGHFQVTIVTTTAKLLQVKISIMRGSIVVAQIERKLNMPVAATEIVDVTITGNDDPAAGTYTYAYAVAVTASDGGSFTPTYSTSAIRAYYSKAKITVGGGHPFIAGDRITGAGVLGFESVNQDDMEIVAVTSTEVWVDVTADETYISGGTWTRSYIEEERQDTGWVMTFITQVGNHVQEGPPGPLSTLLAIGSGEPVSITSIPTAPPSDGGTYNVTGKRIYRSNVGSDGTALFQFVVELALATATYTDSLRFSQLGEALPSETWVKPPATMHGLVEMNNGVLAGIYLNQVCFSEPFQPHAWPTAYRKSFSYTPQALASFGGENLLVATNGKPFVVMGYLPDSFRTQPLELKSPCRSVLGMVDMGDAAVYPGDKGLVYVSSGRKGEVTEEIFAREEWEKIGPTTIIAAEFDGRYVGFHTNYAGVQRGFVFDPGSQTSFWTELDFGADAVWTDPASGSLYIVQDESILRWDANDNERMDYTWRSKRFSTERPCCPAYGRIVSDKYPVRFRLAVAMDQENRDNMTEIMFKSIANGLPFALKGDYLADAFELEVSGDGTVSEIAIGTSIAEIQRG